MEYYQIEGGRPLSGALSIHGAKNSVLPILAACVCCPGVCELRNCPRIADVDTSVGILRSLGCTVERRGSVLTVDASAVTGCRVAEALMRDMRSSVLFMGALLTRCGEVSLTYPGGCALGARPIDLHLWAMERLGVRCVCDGDCITCKGGGLRGCALPLRCPSVGATENALLAALGCRGETVIQNAAREPEIVDLVRFLRAMGAEITGEGTSVITVHGGATLHGAVFSVMPDRIEAATYLCAAAGCGGDVWLENARREDLEAVCTLLEQAGCRIAGGRGGLRIQSRRRLQPPGHVTTGVYPAFPTDAQAPAMAALLRAAGETGFTETVFEDRMRHAAQLRRLGADIETHGCRALVRGVTHLRGAALEATDLRCGAALIVGALQAEGESRVYGVGHVRRGYESIETDLTALGAIIRLCRGH